ncbi:MAG: helix-turn-helix domain-containing protein [Candidatus Magasanikbacteria bacterium]|nr:helix-turn-helix domain-containing protein [Candidatus Magasanikbacteria bacterium]
MLETSKNPRAILVQLGLSDSEVELYLTLVERGALTPRELTTITKAKRPTVYYALRQLMDRGLVTKRGAQSSERFQAEPPEALITMVTLRQQELVTLAEQVNEIIPALKKNKIAHEGAPGVQYYEGKEAMKRAIMDTLYCRKEHIDSIAPADNFFWQIGQEFSAQYIKERVARHITTRNLWEEPLEPRILLQSYKGLSEVRIMPKEMLGNFKTTVFIYDKEVMYISSVAAGFVLVVKSQEHHDLMLAMYNALWAAGKSVTI